MLEGIKVQTTSGPPSPIQVESDLSLKLNCLDIEDPPKSGLLLETNVSDDENGIEAGAEVEDDDVIIQGLSRFTLEPEGPREEYISKGPIFRRNENSHRAAPYQLDPNKSGETKDEQKIPSLPDIDFAIPTEEHIKSVDHYYNQKDSIPEPRLILRNKSNGFHILTNPIFVSIDVTQRKLGVKLPRIQIPDDVVKTGDLVEVLLQPNPRDKRVIPGQAKIEQPESDLDIKPIFIKEQFMVLSPFVIKGISAMEKLLEGVTSEELEAAFSLVNRQDSEDLFKAYGPNNDSMLMTLCCKKDDTPTIRAQVYALASRILSMNDIRARQNIVSKNGSGLSALDYTTVTNNARIAVFLAELFFVLGHDMLGRDSSGNTILHLMARKGDTVAKCLDSLLSIRFNYGPGGKVYHSNLTNGKQFLPLHIAAMSTQCHPITMRILRQDYEHSLHCKTNDGSIPIHLACQYSSDPELLSFLLNCNKNSTVNERRNDGFTPLHLVTARNEEKDVKLGLIPLEERNQLQMIQVLLEHGANRNLTVENYRPVDLLKPDRIQAVGFLRMTSMARKQENRMNMGCFNAGSPLSYQMESPGQLSGGDHSPVMSNPSPSLGQDPFLSNGVYPSDSETSPNMMSHWQSSPYAYHYSPGGHNGSISSGVESHFSGASDDSDDDNNSGAELDAIAQVLITHPTIQAAMEAAARFE